MASCRILMRFVTVGHKKSPSIFPTNGVEPTSGVCSNQGFDCGFNSPPLGQTSPQKVIRRHGQPAGNWGGVNHLYSGGDTCGSGVISFLQNPMPFITQGCDCPWGGRVCRCVGGAAPIPLFMKGPLSPPQIPFFSVSEPLPHGFLGPPGLNQTDGSGTSHWGPGPGRRRRGRAPLSPRFFAYFPLISLI